MIEIRLNLHLLTKYIHIFTHNICKNTHIHIKGIHQGVRIRMLLFNTIFCLIFVDDMMPL